MSFSRQDAAGVHGELCGSAALGKKKNSVALFEVIAKAGPEPDMSVPGWMKGDEPGHPSAEVPAGYSGRQGGGEALISTVPGRLRLSLNYVSCMVAAFGLVVLLSLAFWMGRASVGWSSQATAGLAGTSDGAGRSPAGPAAVVAQAPRRVAGKWYMVIQDLRGAAETNKAEAVRIVSYLKNEFGIPAEVRRYAGRYVVWSFKPFDSRDGQDVRDYAGKIEKIGQRYFKKYSTYRFSQRHNGKLDPWMLKETN